MPATEQPASPTLCAVGDFAWDVVIRTDHALEHGGDTFGHVRLLPGGSAANAAVWAARCGLATHFVGMVGADHLGAIAHQDLAAEGVVDHLVDSPHHATGAVAAFVDHTGQRSMVSGHGADHYLLPQHLPASVIEAATHLHVTGWSFFQDPPRAAAVEAIRRARAGGATVSFDPSAFQLIRQLGVDDFLSLTTSLGITMLFPNREEGEVLTGRSDPTQVAEQLAQRYGGAEIVLKQDADGVLVLADGELVHAPGLPVPAVDATGAGDAFAGAYLARRLRGHSPARAAEFACRVAAHVVANVGARPEAPADLTS